MIDRVKNYKAGRITAVFILLFSLMFLGLNFYTVYTDGQYYPKLLYMGCILFPVSVGMLFFPGSIRKINEYEGGQVRFADLWNDAPKLHRYVWIACMLLGVALAIWLERHVLL